MTIIVIIFKSAVFDKMPFRIVTPNVDVYITRFLATLLMHMNLIEDVKQGLNMILYLNTHPEEFSGTFIPLLCGILQFTGGLAAESTNLFMLATRSEVDMCITFFVAFHVLAEIDKIYAESLCSFMLLESVEEPLVYKRRPKDVKFKDRSLMIKASHILYVVLNFLYCTIYYYYAPFAINFVPYFFAGPTIEHH
jgi:hypothetical protein